MTDSWEQLVFICTDIVGYMWSFYNRQTTNFTILMTMMIMIMMLTVICVICVDL